MLVKWHTATEALLQLLHKDKARFPSLDGTYYFSSPKAKKWPLQDPSLSRALFLEKNNKKAISEHKAHTERSTAFLTIVEAVRWVSPGGISKAPLQLQ